MLIAVTMIAAAAKGGSGGSAFLFLIVIGVALMWLIFIRPQRRKQKQQQSMQSQLTVGDEILTAGGVYGTVTRVDEDEVGVEIAPNVEVRLSRRAIAAQLTERPAEPEAESAAAPESGDEQPG